MKLKKSAASAALKTTDKKTTTIAPAPAASASAPKAVSEAPKTPAEAVTTIEVKADVGFGNAVFLRGAGTGLTWERGVPLVCVDGSTWRWSQKVGKPVTFKVLLNDQVWSAGNDLVVAPGQRLEVSPSFS
ncbi:MAG TPA: hypothetical protein VGO59_03685 [Verrucomicrobiae bacterium]|jgi:hypothetical protein